MWILTEKQGRRGTSRRGFLVAGMCGFGSLTLPGLLRAEAEQGLRGSRKSVIHIHLDGGPPHMDMIDPKADAPVELRGEFHSIPTALPGVRFSELLPRLASSAERLAIIRSLSGSAGAHNAFQCQSGFREDNLQAMGGRPAMGCVLSRLWGRPSDPVPTFVDMMQGRPLVRNSARPGFLGPAFGPFRPDMSRWFSRPLEDGMKNELAALGDHHATAMTLHAELQADRLEDRARLLGQLDSLRRTLDNSGTMDAMDRFHQQAANILTSGRFAEALDLDRVDARTLARYTPAVQAEQHTTSDTPEAARKLLLARRLVEAGVRCVSVSLSDYDTHADNFPRLKLLLPVLDHALSTLLEDLDERGMLDDVAIVVWGEFGRTPKINPRGGRDHWPQVGMALLAGGGMRTGQVIGATDRTGSRATTRPVSHQDVLATLYRSLGLDAHRNTIVDPSGRPQYLLDRGEPLREVLG